MPTYSYKCTECENAFDVQQSFTDDSLTICPVCEGPLRKVFNSIGVTFNGSGFYRTDSRAAARGKGHGKGHGKDGGTDGGKEHGHRAKEPAAKASESASSSSTSSSSTSSSSTSSSSTSSSSPAK